MIAVGLSLGWARPTRRRRARSNTYFFLGYALGLLFAGMYIAVNLAAIGFYLAARRDEFNPLEHARRCRSSARS